MKIGLVGRTNVGKSTIFNRLLGNYRAIVTDISGTTRELLQEKIKLSSREFYLVDSPGLESFDEEMEFIEQIIQESDILIFVVDGKLELGKQEYHIRDKILEYGKKKRTILAVNKLDGKVIGPESDLLIADFYQLGFEEIVPLAAQQYEGLEDLVDSIYKKISSENIEVEEIEALHEKAIPLAIVGRPNVGKSTLLNKLVGETVAHVQDKPGTTLDYISSKLDRQGKEFMLYDTAGIRKKKKIVGLEKIAFSKTISMLKHVRPMVVQVIDIVEGVTHRDKTLLGEIVALGLPLIIAINKIDLYDANDVDLKIKNMKYQLGFEWIPVVRISGEEAIGLGTLMTQAYNIYKGARKRVPTGQVNSILQKARLLNPPRFPKNKICKWKYITQVENDPPTFNLSVNNKDFANFSFKRRVEKIIRKSYPFTGVPIKLTFTSKIDKNPYLKRD